jgi:hypothetical protein
MPPQPALTQSAPSLQFLAAQPALQILEEDLAASLVEVEADAAAVIRAAHQVRAATASLDELAAAEAEQALLDLDDTVVVHQADVVVSLPTGEYADSELPVAVRVDGRGHVSVATSSHVRFGPVDGQTQLDVATALRALAQALTGCWQPPEEA